MLVNAAAEEGIPVSKFRRVTRACLALIVLGTGLLVSVPGPVNAAFPGSNGRIYFYRQVGGDESTNEIFSMKPDGTNKKRLTNNSTNDEDPQLSPNGRWVVFEREVNGNADIFKMKPDGSQVTRLTNNAAGTVDNKDPGWSPTGQRIVFSSDRNGDDSLYLMNADGTGETRLTFPDSADDDSNPRWAPNGEKIAFTREFDSASVDASICVIRPNASGETCITGDQFDSIDDPDWSPNSMRITFEGHEPASPSANENIYTMNPNGDNVVQRTARNDHASDPAYSPDGSKIIFEVKEDPPNSLFRMNADGSNERRVTPATYDVQDPDWGVKP
jgi:Tol biopolymer transport system component